MRVRLVVTAKAGDADEAISLASRKGLQVEQLVSAEEGLHFLTLEGTLRPGDLVGLLDPMRGEVA